MSFASDIKEEILNSFSTNKKICCINAEKFGENLTQAYMKYEIDPKFNKYFDIAKLDDCCIKSIIKGAFLGAGYIVDPIYDYHFELLTKNKACADYIFNLLSVLEFTPKIIKKKKLNVFSIYIKDSEQISLLLSILGANSGVLKFEQIRVEKEVKNNINRAINCEAANISKTVTSSVKQIDAIEKIREAGILNDLDDKLKYTIYLREKYPDGSLDFLSNKSSEENKVSKSGLKHRFDKLIDIAEKLDNIK